MEMESVKPSFDVLLQTGIHHGPYGYNLQRRRRPHTSKSLHEGVDKAGRRGHDRGHGSGKDDAAESRYSGDWHSRPSTTYGDSEKRKTYDREQDRAARWMSDFSDLSPTRKYKTLEKVNASPGSSLSAMVMRASHLTDADLKDFDSSSWSTYATLPRSSHYRHYPGAAVISVEELPRPQRGTYRVETEKTHTAGGDDRASSSVGWRLSSAQSDGPAHLSARPLSMHGDELMTYLHETESTPGDFTLNAILTRREESKHQPVQSVGASTGDVYTGDDEIGRLYRLLDNPFTGHKQQVR